ncbi:MAG TPA: hypothetical protein VF796_25630 [Humisphaera sp.]
MHAKRFLFGCVLTLGAAGVVAPAVAAPPVAPKPESPIVAARRQLTEANVALNAAKQQQTAVKAKVAAKYKTENPDYAKAEAAAVKTKADAEATRKAALTAVQAKKEYQTALANKEAQVERLRALPASASDFQRDKITNELDKYRTELQTMDRSVDADPKVVESKRAADEAARALDAFKAQLEAACAADPDYVAATAAVTDAETRLAAATEALKQAQASNVRPRTPAPAPK